MKLFKCFRNVKFLSNNQNVHPGISLYPNYFCNYNSIGPILLNNDMYIHQRHFGSRPIRPDTITKDDRRDFMAVFPDIVRDVTDFNSHLRELRQLFSKVLQYNVAGGKKIRGLTVVHSYRMLNSPEELTEENVRTSQVIGWCIEMLQGYFVIIDDIADQSTTRRGKPCWYTLPDVGLRALSDATLVHNAVFELIKKHCKQQPYYVHLMELFLEASKMTSYGQTLDHCSSSVNISNLNIDRYNAITEYKTSYYSFHLPVAAAMYMSGIYSEELHRQAKNVLVEMGRYFQVQDDFLDVFGDEEVTGKKGTDIQDGKCTWLAIIAFQRSSASQQAILKEAYGSKDPEKIEAVKDVYNELGLPSLYNAYEEETYNLITKQIQQLSEGLPHELFFSLLERIYGRRK